MTSSGFGGSIASAILDAQASGELFSAEEFGNPDGWGWVGLFRVHDAFRRVLPYGDGEIDVPAGIYVVVQDSQGFQYADAFNLDEMDSALRLFEEIGIDLGAPVDAA